MEERPLRKASGQQLVVFKGFSAFDANNDAKQLAIFKFSLCLMQTMIQSRLQLSPCAPHNAATVSLLNLPTLAKGLAWVNNMCSHSVINIGAFAEAEMSIVYGLHFGP